VIYTSGTSFICMYDLWLNKNNNSIRVDALTCMTGLNPGFSMIATFVSGTV